MEMLSNLLTVTGQVATLFLMMAVGFVLIFVAVVCSETKLSFLSRPTSGKPAA